MGWALASACEQLCCASSVLDLFLSISLLFIFIIVVIIMYYFISIINLFLPQPVSFTFFWTHRGRAGSEWASAKYLCCRLQLNHSTAKTTLSSERKNFHPLDDCLATANMTVILKVCRLFQLPGWKETTLFAIAEGSFYNAQISKWLLKHMEK